MKRIFFNMMIPVIIIPLFISCDGMMDTHKEFIKDGEIIYSPKVDSLSFIAGEGRVLFEFWLYKSPNVKSVDVYWNSKKDSLRIPVTVSAERDSFYVQIPNLAEQAYTFDVRTTDNFGHKSLWVSGFGNSYGERYRNTLGNRRVNTVALVEEGGLVKGSVSFFSAGTLLMRTEIRYQENGGTTKTVKLLPTGSTVLCPVAKPGTAFEYRSLYIPETEAIDTFATAWTTFETVFPNVYRYDRSSWEVLAVSDETASDGGGKATVIDGDLGSYWHSQWDGGNAPLPHWVIIDMKEPKNVVLFDIYRRPGNTDARTVECYLGDTPDAAGVWTKIGTGVFSSGDKLVIEPADKTVKGRYLILNLPDSNRSPFTSIAEIYPYGG